MSLEDPYELLARLRLGREEYCQRLLTMLILDGPYPRWNNAVVPSPVGLAFLHRLEALSFGAAEPWAGPAFIDEFDLPARHLDERGGAPDWALKDDRRLWMIELKTERGSHRADQLPSYFILGRHHHPRLHIDITYLTPPFDRAGPTVPEGIRYAHLTWPDVLPLVSNTWRSSSPQHSAVVRMLERVLGALNVDWPTWKSAELEAKGQAPVGIVSEAVPVSRALDAARLTAEDKQQRAVDFTAGSLQHLKDFRLHVQEAIWSDESLLHVRPCFGNQGAAGSP